jgi:transposase
MRSFYIEIGSINGYNRYTVMANSERDAFIKAIKFYKSKGRNINGETIKVATSRYSNAVKTYYC